MKNLQVRRNNTTRGRLRKNTFIFSFLAIVGNFFGGNTALRGGDLSDTAYKVKNVRKRAGKFLKMINDRVS